MEAEKGEMERLRKELEAMKLSVEKESRAREEAERREEEEKRARKEAERARKEAERARKEAERREEEEKRARKEAERARKEAERREEEEWRAGMRRRWPPDLGSLVHVDLAPASTSHTNPPNMAATPIVAHVELADHAFPRAEDSKGSFYTATSNRTVRTEADTTPIVDGFVLDVISALGLDLKLSAEYKFDGVKPDSWVVRSRHGHPVGMVEVKKPPKHNEKPLESERVLGEVFDALHVLRNRWGVRPAVAILATGWEWRVLWWDEDDEWRAMGFNHGRREDPAPCGTPARQLGASQIITADGGALRRCEYHGARFPYTYEVHPAVDLVAGALCVMNGSAPEIPSGDPFRDADKRAFAHLNSETRADWVAGVGSSGADWKWEQMPGRQVVRLIVVAPLGSGRDGSVFLVGHMSSMTVGVLKWAKSSGGDQGRSCQDAAEREAANWVAAYGKEAFPDVRCGVWDGGHAVLLPYLEPLRSREERHAALDDGDVKNALHAMAERRFLHDDVDWRHVARRVRWGTSSKREDERLVDGSTTTLVPAADGVVFIDLAGGRCVEDDEDWDAEKWVEDRVAHLRDTVDTK